MPPQCSHDPIVLPLAKMRTMIDHDYDDHDDDGGGGSHGNLNREYLVDLTVLAQISNHFQLKPKRFQMNSRKMALKKFVFL